MSGAKGRNRIEKRLVDMSAAPAPEPVPAWTANLDECVQDEYPIVLGADDRLYLRFNTDTHDRVVEFAMMQQTRVAGKWVDVVRIDTAHGAVHTHRMRSRGNESKEGEVPITCAEDVTRAYNDAYDSLLSEWEDNLGRWRDGR